MQEGHTSLSDELHKGKSKAKIRTQNVLQYVAVSLLYYKSFSIFLCICSHIQDKMEAATDFILAPGLKLVHRAAKVDCN